MLTHCNLIKPLLRIPILHGPAGPQFRGASLTSAIERGIRKSKHGFDSAEKRESRSSGRKHRTTNLGCDKSLGEANSEEPRDLKAATRLNQNEGIAKRNRTACGQREVLKRRNSVVGVGDLPHSRVAPDLSQKLARSIPYTTAASEFIYGSFAVRAALQSARRKFYKLYVYRGRDAIESHIYKSIHKLALAHDVDIVEVSQQGKDLLSRISSGRPHNGFILEASPIPNLPVTAMETMKSISKEFQVLVAPQSAEDAEINRCFNIGSSGRASLPLVETTRFPFILMLDRILDPGNLGAIIRTCFFLGVDAVVMTEHGTAPVNAVTIKASAGAAEYLPLMRVKDDVSFLQASKRNDWKIFAAATGLEGFQDRRPSVPSNAKSLMDGALLQGPCILMMGNEGDGLRPHLQRLADSRATIAMVRGFHEGIDSLNVSVAAALLCHGFLESARSGGEAIDSLKESSDDDRISTEGELVY